MTEPAFDLNKLIGPDWRGKCVVCGKDLARIDWVRQRVVAIIEGEKMFCSCTTHAFDGRYEEMVQKIASAVVEEMKG